MEENKTIFKTIDEYILNFSPEVQEFPLSKPMPYELISRIVKFRVAENMKDAESKIKKK